MQTTNDVMAQFIVLLRTIYHDIPESLLTVNDRNTLNLKKRDIEPSPIEIVNYAPNAILNSAHHLVHNLRFSDPTTPDSKKMPYGHKVEVQMAYKTAVAPVWAKIGIATRFLFTVNFIDADLAKTVLYRFRYINTRGKQGNWSEILQAVVM